MAPQGGTHHLSGVCYYEKFSKINTGIFLYSITVVKRIKREFSKISKILEIVHKKRNVVPVVLDKKIDSPATGG